MSHGESTIGVEDQLFYATLFTMGIDWYGPIVEYLKKGYFKNDILKEEKVVYCKSNTYYPQEN
jgi:hypothetical protein